MDDSNRQFLQLSTREDEYLYWLEWKRQEEKKKN